MKTLAYVLAAAGSFGILYGQSILVSPAGVVAPGASVTISVDGSVANPLYLNGTRVFILTETGDLVTPRFRQGATTTFVLTGAIPSTFPFQLPASGAGSSGSHVIYVPSCPGPIGPAGPPGFCGLVARVDIGTATPGFPALSSFPLRVSNGFGSYASFLWAPYGSSDWCMANTSNAAVTLAAGDIVQVFTPGGTTPLSNISLAGLTVPPGFCMSFSLSLGALVPGPYTVQVSWTDPVAGPVVRRTGINGTQVSVAADVHLPRGRTIPLGGLIESYVQIAEMSTPPTYALLLGYLPGTTPLSNGVVVPLVADELVIASLSGGLAPYVLNSIGTATPAGPGCAGYCVPGGPLTTTASGIFLIHPGPLASGIVLRLAAIAFTPAGSFVASQPQEISFQ